MSDSIIGTHRSSGRLLRRIRDFVLYITIGLSAVAVVIAVSRTALSDDAFSRLAGFFLFTPVLFGYFIADSRPWWRSRFYWVLMVLFLLIHSVGFAAVTDVVTFKPIWMAAITIPELAVFIVCRDWLVLHGRIGGSRKIHEVGEYRNTGGHNRD